MVECVSTQLQRRSGPDRVSWLLGVAKWRKRRSSRNFRDPSLAITMYPQEWPGYQVLIDELCEAGGTVFSRVIPMPVQVTYNCCKDGWRTRGEPCWSRSPIDMAKRRSSRTPASADRHLPAFPFWAGNCFRFAFAPGWSGSRCWSRWSQPGAGRDASLGNPVESIFGRTRASTPRTHVRRTSRFAPTRRPHPPPIGSLVPLWS